MDKFKNAEMDEAAFQEFFSSGEDHITFVVDTLEEAFGAEPGKQKALDFGCGVGRLALPLAKKYDHVTGVDISPSMLDEAKQNAAKFEQENLTWISSLDELKPTDLFDLVHCFIVFQHIRPHPGYQIVKQLVDHLQEGGTGALQFLYKREVSPFVRLLGWCRAHVPLFHPLINLMYGKPRDEPLMEKNVYDLNQILYILEQAGCADVRVRFQGNDALRNIFLFFRKKPAPVPYDDFYNS